MLEHKPRFTGRMPLWTSLALADLRDKGAGAADLAARFGVKPSTIHQRWVAPGL